MLFKTSDNTVVSSDNAGCFPPRSETGLACTLNTYIQYIPRSYAHFKRPRKEIKGKAMVRPPVIPDLTGQRKEDG